MAKTYGGTSQKILIYGYLQKRDGLRYKSTDKLSYFPEIKDQVQDPNMPKRNLRYFKLDFNTCFLGKFADIYCKIRQNGG